MCKLTKKFQDSGGGFDKGGEIQGEGLRPPSELCFGTNRLLCFMLIYYVYIPDPIIKLLVMPVCYRSAFKVFRNFKM